MNQIHQLYINGKINKKEYETLINEYKYRTYMGEIQKFMKSNKINS